MRSIAFCLALLCGLLLIPGGETEAAEIHADGVTCSLADAIVAANSDTATGGCPEGDFGADTIVLDADVTLTGPDAGSTNQGGGQAGLPDITDDLTIRAGLGRVIRSSLGATCSAAGLGFRFFNLEAGSLVLEGLSFEEGCFVASANGFGGGIATASGTELTLVDVTVRDHHTLGTGVNFDGGFLHSRSSQVVIEGGVFEEITIAVFNLRGGVIFGESFSGPIALRGVAFRDLDVEGENTFQGGVLATSTDTEVSGCSFTDLEMRSSRSFQGGVLYASNSSFVSFILDGSSVTDLVASGNGVQGGALYTNQQTQIRNTVFARIQAISLSGCSGGAVYSTSSGDPLLDRVVVAETLCQGAGFAEGGGLFSSSPDTVVLDSLFRDNQARFGGPTSNGRGGAILAFDGVRIERSTFLGCGVSPLDSAAAGDAAGGALWISDEVTLRNVTVADSSARAGDGQGQERSGGSARGGAIFYGEQSGGRLDAAHLTLTGNQAIAGDADPGLTDGDAEGGGLYIAASDELAISNSIVSGNTITRAEEDPLAEDCFAAGVVSSSGYNLVLEPDATCEFAAFGDIVGLDPELYPVADYGCYGTLPDGSCLPTAAIDQTSWAVDWGSCGESGVFDDARGQLRREDVVGVPNLADACDAGAFEARDGDEDGVTDAADLCPAVADPDQADGDLDEIGDACDLCMGDNATGDSDGDRVCDGSDVCPGFDDGADEDGDQVPDGCDLCFGDDATGDGDDDGLCADVDCDDGDPANACPIFVDGFESGDTLAWSASVS
ncbi:MAG: hypothetical protein AAF604_05880 [Acidobacteriota bacterium]